jgi:ABC-type lipoprotein export system ATPase subunit
MSNSSAIATAVVETHDVTRDFQIGAVTVHALRGIDLLIQPGEFVALRGRSGSGKTTLLNMLVGLDDPTQGQVITLGHNLAQLNEAARAALRRQSIGLLFQNATSSLHSPPRRTSKWPCVYN